MTWYVVVFWAVTAVSTAVSAVYVVLTYRRDKPLVKAQTEQLKLQIKAEAERLADLEKQKDEDRTRQVVRDEIAKKEQLLDQRDFRPMS